MERFAFKIDNVLRANLYKICRLCGIDNPDKVPILGEHYEREVVDVDAEPELSQKIYDLIGFSIKKDDKMPQMICSICVDKINDFYEFREMCFATDIQTRKLLGLKDPPKKSVEIKVEVKTERGRKRKCDDIAVEGGHKLENEKQNFNLSKKKARVGLLKEEKKLKKNSFAELEKFKTEVKNEVFEDLCNPATYVNKKNLTEVCNICKERFGTKYKLNRHKFITHSPNIARYVCTTCEETLKKNSDIKSHQLWHKLTNTPYTCALCREVTTSINLHTRHMREHAQKLATPLLVLDRQCGQCNLTFCTNFLYNTHPCAVRTRKCGGCNRQIKNEVDYHRHASTCEKAYLTISKHLSDALEAVRIKNENDIEAAAESLGINVESLGIKAPITSISGNSIDNIVNSADVTPNNKSAKKGGKKGISKKDLKRVDDLLKSTMDALVSIKHEPEMHVEADVTNHAEQQNNAHIESEHFPANDFADDDFQNRDDYSEDDDGCPLVPIVQLQTGNDIVIKKEPLDNTDLEATNTSESVNNVEIKKEILDSGYEDSSAGGLAAKIPPLKLKITKEHGTLNSSLVNESLMAHEKKKKKKKRKDLDKANNQTDGTENRLESPLNTPEASLTKSACGTAMPTPGIVHIKQERLDDDYPDENWINDSSNLPVNNDTNEFLRPEATVMTSIPIMQFQIACVSSGVEFNEPSCEKGEQPDVKPSRAELEHWLERTNSSALGSVDRAEERNSSNKLNSTQNSSQNTMKPTTFRSKAVKSTGGISRQNNSCQEIPKIVSVSSGYNAIEAHTDKTENSYNFAVPNIVVKAEPLDNGYETSAPLPEQMISDQDMETSLPFADSHQNSQQSGEADGEEQAYINSIDFSNICIKQEKDIDVAEPQLTAQQIPANLYNKTEEITKSNSAGIKNIQEKESQKSVCKSTDEAEEDKDDDDEVEEEDDDMEPNEKDDDFDREYRELEWPPPQIEPKEEVIENSSMSLGLVISNVCSQANNSLLTEKQSPNVAKSHEGKPVTDELCSTKTTVLKNIIHNDNFSPSSNQLNNIEKHMGGQCTTATDIPDLQGASICVSSFTPLDSKIHASTKENELESGKTEETVSSISIKFTESSENLLESSTCSKSIGKESNMVGNVSMENIDEEQQNILNHEVLANSEVQANNEIVTHSGSTASNAGFTRTTLSTELHSVEKNSPSAKFTDGNEEADNFFNENVDAGAQCQLSGQESMHCIPVAANTQTSSQQRSLLFDDNNINEIAENNNNANIERELLDDNSSNTERSFQPLTVEQENSIDEVT